MSLRTSIRRRLAIATALVVVAAAADVVVTLPPRALVVSSAWRPARPSVRGIIHVHTTRSDGTGSVAEVAAAAERAGLDFIAITDHGDGTRRPDAPAYAGKVLVIDAVEISTDGGHYAALGLPRTPYPLGGEPRDVVADVSRLGGFGFAAHPGSPKPALRWTDWSAPIDGLEWLNGDSEWRDEPWGSLARGLAQYFVRGPEALASLLDRPESVLARWDALTATRRVVGIAASDAHERLGWRAAADPYPSGPFLRIPTYEAAFRTLSIVAELNAPLTRDPGRDAASVLGALRAGHVVSVVTALAAPAPFEFIAISGESRARAGDPLRLEGPVHLRAHVDGPPGTQLALMRGGRPVIVSPAPDLQYEVSAEPGVYRVEARLPNAPGSPAVPWVVSNPVYVGNTGSASPPPSRPSGSPLRTLYGDGLADGWHVESAPGSLGALDIASAVGGSQLMFRWALQGGARAGQFAAAVRSVPEGLVPADRLVFKARASQPMRLSVQLRGAGDAAHRWRRSVFLDEVLREVTIWFDEVTPVGQPLDVRPDPGRVDSLLFVVDTVNAQPGASGTVFLDDVRTERPGATSAP